MIWIVGFVNFRFVSDDEEMDSVAIGTTNQQPDRNQQDVNSTKGTGNTVLFKYLYIAP